MGGFRWEKEMMILHMNTRMRGSFYIFPRLDFQFCLQRCVPRETRFLAWQPKSIYTIPIHTSGVGSLRVWGIGAVERQPQSSG